MELCPCAWTTQNLQGTACLPVLWMCHSPITERLNGHLTRYSSLIINCPLMVSVCFWGLFSWTKVSICNTSTKHVMGKIAVRVVQKKSFINSAVWNNNIQNSGKFLNYRFIAWWKWKKKTCIFLKWDTADICLNVKAIPVKAWTSPAGARRLRLPDFKTVGTVRW